MEPARIRRCSLAVIALQAMALPATVAARLVEPYFGMVGALLQALFAALALGVALGCWLVARPRGATLAWLWAMPATGAAATASSLLLLASVRWGC